MNKHQLLAYITQVSFSLDDAILFLDTHPCDKEALNYYHSVKQLREKAVAKYNKEFGPLTNMNNENTCEWDWVKTPWPWE